MQKLIYGSGSDISKNIIALGRFFHIICSVITLASLLLY